MSDNKISNKFDELIIWINKNERVPKRITPAVKTKLIASGVSLEDVEQEKVFYNFIIEHKYETADHDVQVRLDTCPAYMQWNNKLKASRIGMSYEDRYNELVDWITKNNRLPRILKPAKRAQLIESGMNVEEVNTESTLGTFMYDSKNKYENQPEEIRSILNKCPIYMSWSRSLTTQPDSKVKELIQWIEQNNRIPRKLEPKRRAELVASGQETEEVLVKELGYYNYCSRNKYETHSDDAKKLLDECEIYTKWRLSK